MDATGELRLARLVRLYKYRVLLALLVVWIVAQSYRLHGGWIGALSDALRTLISVTIFLVVFHDAHERAPATTLSLFAALFGMFCTAVVVAQFVGLAQGASRDKP